MIPRDDIKYLDDIKPEHLRMDPTVNRHGEYEGLTVKIQAQHFLHCVNLLRQGLWYNHDYYRQTNHPSWNAAQDVMYGRYSLAEIHTAHCIDQLRQLIMCEVDLGVVPFLEDTTGTVYMDFARRKQCRNWQSFLQWHEKWKWEAGRLTEEGNIPGHEIPYFSWTGE